MSISLSTIDQFINFALSLATMQVSKKAFFQDPKIVWSFRIVYLCSNLFQLFFYYFIRSRIAKVNDQRKLRIKKDVGIFQENDVEEEIEILYSEYDMRELNKISKSALVQVLIVTVIHLKWKVMQPLVVSASLPLRYLFLNPLYLAYVLGKDVLRPFELNVFFKKVEEKIPEKKRKKEE